MEVNIEITLEPDASARRARREIANLDGHLTGREAQFEIHEHRIVHDEPLVAEVLIWTPDGMAARGVVLATVEHFVNKGWAVLAEERTDEGFKMRARPNALVGVI